MNFDEVWEAFRQKVEETGAAFDSGKLISYLRKDHRVPQDTTYYRKEWNIPFPDGYEQKQRDFDDIEDDDPFVYRQGEPGGVIPSKKTSYLSPKKAQKKWDSSPFKGKLKSLLDEEVAKRQRG